MKKRNEVAVLGKESASVDTFISQAISAGLPVETLERLFALREKVKAEAAREAYLSALSRFQEACPIIKKTKKVVNKDGTTRYVFAPIESIVEQIKKPLADNGLSYRWETKQEEGKVKAICIVTHKMGHSESSDFEVGVDKEGFMTAPQKIASALTFAKRYSLCNTLGVSTGDEDVDATDQKKDRAPKSDKSKIIMLLRMLKSKTETLEDVQASVKYLAGIDLEEKNYVEIVARLEETVREQQEYANKKVR